MPNFRNPWKRVEHDEEGPSKGTAYFGYVPNASLSDAKSYVSAWLEKYIEAPGAAGLYLHKYREGYLFEIQERGIGKRSWLPSILETWDRQLAAGEEQSITLALDRTVQGQRQGERISFVVLPESIQNLETTPGLVSTGPHLVSLRKDYSAVARGIRWTFWGTAVILMVSLGIKAFHPHTIVKAGAMPAPVAVFKLPIAQWPTLVAAPRKGKYVLALRYQNRVWHVQTAKSPLAEQRPNAPTLSSPAIAPARSSIGGKH